jgi:hypothetical protein
MDLGPEVADAVFRIAAAPERRVFNGQSSPACRRPSAAVP